MSLGIISMQQDRGRVGRIVFSLPISSVQVYNGINSSHLAEACCSKGKLITSLCVLQFLCCYCEKKNAVIDVSVMVCVGFIATQRLSFPRSTGKLNHIHNNQQGNCRVAMVTDADVTIFIMKPVNYVHSARCKSIFLTEPLCHSDAGFQIMKLRCCLHSLIIASRHRECVSLSSPHFPFDKLSLLMSGAGQKQRYWLCLCTVTPKLLA